MKDNVEDEADKLLNGEFIYVESDEVKSALNDEKVKSAQLNNLLLDIMVKSEALKLKHEEEVDKMINEFLGYGDGE